MAASVSYSFSPTTTIESSQTNQNFTDLVNYFNNTACVTGMVTMWAGAIGSIPTGWQLCNGSSGSPDMRDRFVIGAGNTYSIDNTGGDTTKDISHTHGDGSYAVSGNTGSGGDTRINNDGSDNYCSHVNHTHTFSASVTGTSASGGSSSQDIMPPYYALAFIYKT